MNINHRYKILFNLMSKKIIYILLHMHILYIIISKNKLKKVRQIIVHVFYYIIGILLIGKKRLKKSIILILALQPFYNNIQYK